MSVNIKENDALNGIAKLIPASNITLSSLPDTNITLPQAEQSLGYDEASGRWINYNVRISVYYSDDFRGLNISCTKGQTTITKTAPMDGNAVVFYVNEKGTWTVSAEIGATSYTDTVVVTSFGVTYPAQLVTSSSETPEGATVTPTDDIQTWLACANLDKPYTTLEAVLADRETFETLIADSNACDYMARSTTWAGITGGLVPAMTSTTQPSGEVDAESQYSNDYADWKAFNGSVSNNGWLPNSSATVGNTWIQYEFPSAKIVNCLGILQYWSTSSYSYTKKITVKIEGSNNGTDFIQLASNLESTYSWNEWAYCNFNNSSAYKLYRITITGVEGTTSSVSLTSGSGTKLQLYQTGITTNQDAMALIGKYDYCSVALLKNNTWASAITNSDYFEGVLNTRVPIMTSDTTPSGEVIYSTAYNSGSYRTYGAFDGNTSTYWMSQDSTVASNSAWCGYDFGYPLYLGKYELAQDNNRITGWVIEGTNDKTGTWYEVASVSNTTIPTTMTKYNVDTYGTAYRYYRFRITSTLTAPNSSPMREIQFYGHLVKEVYVPLVPTMTSNTTPSGECMSSDMASPYMAFDGNDSTFSNTNSGVYTGSIIYDFQKQVVVNASYIDGNWSTGYNIYGSTNNTDWTELGTNLSPASIVSFNNTNEYRYYKITVLGSISSYVRIYTAQLYQKTVKTNIVHSSANDTIYYLDEGSPVIVATTNSDGDGILDFSTLEDKEYTFYSSVAKDPSNLSNDFSKAIRITKSNFGGTTEMYLMPDAVKTLYWWGYENGIEDITTANGWSYSRTLLGATHNSTDLYFNSNNNSLAGIASSQIINSGNTLKALAFGVTIVGSTYGGCAISTSKATNFNQETFITSSSLTKYEINMNSNGYFIAYADNGRKAKVNALWYE